MKKLLAVILVIFVLCSCGQGQVSSPTGGDLNGENGFPPKLILEYGGTETAATVGSYNWEQDNGDGTATNTIACGLHPLQFGDIATLTAGKANSFTLVFADGMVSYEISRWAVGENYLLDGTGESYEIGDEEKVTADNNTLVVPDDGKIYVYALSVHYESGTVEYGFKIEPADEWGVTLSVKNVTAAGATLVFTQSGGNPTGELTTGSYYRIENVNNEELAFLVDDVVWTAEAYVIPKDGKLEMPVKWKSLYGELPEGTYRIYKQVMDFRGTGDYDEKEYFAEFTIPFEENTGGKEAVSIAQLKIVDGAESGQLVLAGTGAGEVYTLTVGDIPVYLDGEKEDASVLEDGMTAEIRYNGDILETYPATFGEVDSIHVYSLGTKNNPGGTYYDLCGLYLKVLNDLWETDSGLNGGAEYVSVDLSEAPGNLTEGEKSAVAWIFGCEHGLEALTLTMEELIAEGWLVAAGGSDDLYRWDNGVLMTITDDWGEDFDTHYSLPTIKFNAMKWRSPLGAYIFSGCSAVWPQMGTWTDYNVGAHAIS